MIIVNTDNSNYELLDFEDGFKYEEIDGVIIKRPDSNASGSLSNPALKDDLYAQYNEEAGEGQFDLIKEIQDPWLASIDNLNFKLKLGSYKHIGIFPEQSYHWNIIKDKIQKSENEVKVLNLFAYTGAASINAAKAGAKEVVHVEALKQLNNWAKENSELNDTEECNIRYMNDDVITFLKREVKRGNKYQIIIMDPPSFGRGPKGQIWKFQDNIDELLNLTKQLLENPLCVIISTYTNNFDKNQLKEVLSKYFKESKVSTYDMYLKSRTDKLLSCGSGGICEF